LVDPKEIDNNIQTWKEQVAPIIDFERVTIRCNGDWINNMSIKDFIALASHVSAVQLFKRESFTRRIEAGDTVWYHETMYPLLQGNDSVVLDVDLEIGGTDQEFNMLMGRELQKKINGKDKFVLETPMILGTDGRQMSKTSDNCIWLTDTPENMYGKLMSVHDDQTATYFELCTNLSTDEVKNITASTNGSPKDFKLAMALAVTAVWHGQEKAEAAQRDWLRRYSEKKLPEDIPIANVATGEWELAELLMQTGLVASKSEAKRLIDQGGIRINQEVITQARISVVGGDVLQAGKRRFLRFE
jgi:tyrosyl-tRNA synthetase